MKDSTTEHTEDKEERQLRERSKWEKLLMFLVGICSVLVIVDTSINLVAKYEAGKAIIAIVGELGNGQGKTAAVQRPTLVPLEPIGTRRGTPNDGFVEVYFNRTCLSYSISYMDSEGKTVTSPCEGDYALLPHDVKSFTFMGSNWTLE